MTKSKAKTSARVYGLYSEEDIQLAVKFVNEHNYSLRAACSQTGVPVTTIRRRLDADQPVRSIGRPPVLTKEEEERLTKYFINMCELGLGMTRGMGNDLVRKLTANRAVPWKRDEGPGRDWWDSFFKRNPSMSFRKPEKLARERVRMDSDVVLIDHFDKLEALKAKHNFKVSNQYNMDETKSDPKPQRVIALKGQRIVNCLTDDERGNVTVVGCICADGTSMPPLIIHQGATVPIAWYTDGALPAITFSTSESGWIDTTIFQGWFKTFVKYATARRMDPSDPILLVMDGQLSHISLDTSDLAMANNIILYQLPPHTSHRTQPLDLACFSSWHDKFGEARQRRINAYPRRPITKIEFADLMAKPWSEALSAENIKAGFRKAGIEPLDRSKVLRKAGQATPNDALDLLAQTATAQIAPTPTATTTPAPPSRRTSLEVSLRTPKTALLNTIEDLAKELDQVSAHLQVEKRLRLEELTRPPLSDATNLPNKQPSKRVVTRGRVLTEQEVRAEIAANAAAAAAKKQKPAAKATSSAPTSRTKPTSAPVASVAAAPLAVAAVCQVPAAVLAQAPASGNTAPVGTNALHAPC